VSGLYEIYCDGGCKVGHDVGVATYLFVMGGEVQFAHTTLLTGKGLTNNQAEYTAVYLSLTDVVLEGKCNIYSDSEIVVKQLNGNYKVKEKKLQTLNNNIMMLVKDGAVSPTFYNVPRENKYIVLCDKINKQIMEMI